MATKTETGNKGRRYAEQVLDESFLKEQMPWTATAQFFELSLHVGDPQDAEGRLQNEISYPRYERPRLPRDRLTWQRSGNVVKNRIEARFALCQEGGKQTATHWALTPIGEAGPAYLGPFVKAIVIEPGIRPVIDPGLIEVRES